MRGVRTANVCSRLRYTGQRGFSLIEILIAMTVTLIGLAGLLSLHVTTTQGNSRATRMVVGSVIAQQTMEQLRSLPVQPPFSGYPGLTLQSQYGIAGTCPGAATDLGPVVGPDQTRFLPRVSVCALFPPGDPLENLVRVRVEIIWADQGADPTTTDASRRHQMVIESVRTRQDVI